MTTSPAQPLTVLVADDTATNRQILQVFLGKLGFRVVVAEDGAKAVAAYTAERPDIVLMDVMMPVMDGYEATRRIKALATDHWVPVIFLSALDKEENLVAGLDAGGDDYLAKPVNFVVLDAKLRSVVRTLDLQRSLAQERLRAQAITDNLVDALVTVDERGIVQWCNSAAEAVFGYGREELVGRNVGLLMPPPYNEQHDGYIRRYLESGVPHVIGRPVRQLAGRRKDGSVFPIELGVAELGMSEQRLFVGVVRDITERVRAEVQLRDNAARLQAYHDTQQVEQGMAQEIVDRQLRRDDLSASGVQFWLSPAANFSGDIVGATRGPAGERYAILADARGHGLAAAICTLPVLSVFYSLAATGASLSTIVREVNHQLFATLPVGYFVAAALVRMPADAGEVEAWLGGTPDLLVVGSDGRVRDRIVSEHLPLGIDALATLGTQRLSLAADDQVLLCSDGLLEAENADKQAFGLERLSGALAGASAAARMDAVRDALVAHLQGAAPHDDISLLIVDAHCGS